MMLNTLTAAPVHLDEMYAIGMDDCEVVTAFVSRVAELARWVAELHPQPQLFQRRALEE